MPSNDLLPRMICCWLALLAAANALISSGRRCCAPGERGAAFALSNETVLMCCVATRSIWGEGGRSLSRHKLSGGGEGVDVRLGLGDGLVISGAHGLGGTIDCVVSARVSSGVLRLYTDGCRNKVGIKCSSSLHDSGVGAYWETVRL